MNTNVHARDGIIRTFVLGTGLFLCALLAGGCLPQGKMPDLHTTEEFDQQVVRSDRPVLVDFYKDNCPTCVEQERVLEELIDEYAGRVKFVRFKIREATMQESAPEIMDRYKLFWVPTVILFVDGKEQKRWVFNHMAFEFRGVLDDVLSGRPVKPSAENNGNFTFDENALKNDNMCVEGKGCRIERNGK